LRADHRWAQLAFGQVVGGINAIVIQKGKEMVALFIEAIAHGFFALVRCGESPELGPLCVLGLGASR
jgi:hypothetical protein